MFHKVPGGKTVKNRLHFDLVTSQIASETDRFVELGATRTGETEEDGRIRGTAFAGPEGNGFDLVAS